MAITPYPTDADVVGGGSAGSHSGRSGRLQELLSRITPGPFGSALAIIVVAIGIAVIGWAYAEAAGGGGEINGVTDIRAQLPYLLSGGFIGLGLIVLGGSLMVAHSHRTDRARLEAKLDELIDAARAGGGAAAAPTDLRQLVVAGSASYHTPQCRLVDGRPGVAYLTPEEAAGRGLAPCRICRPAAAEASTLS